MNTLNNYFDQESEKQRKIHKRNFTNDYSNIKLIKPNIGNQIKRTVLNDQLSKQQNVFNVDNVKMMKEKILKFCKKYNFNVNQVNSLLFR